METSAAERTKTKKAAKKTIFEMSWDEFMEYINRDNVKERRKKKRWRKQE